MRTKGLEPPRLSTPDPKSGAATITPRAQNVYAKLLKICLTAKFLPFESYEGSQRLESDIVVVVVPIIRCQQLILHSYIHCLFVVLFVARHSHSDRGVKEEVFPVGEVTVIYGYISVGQ